MIEKEFALTEENVSTDSDQENNDNQESQDSQEAQESQESQHQKTTNNSGSAFYRQKLEDQRKENLKLKSELEIERKKGLLERQNYKELYENESQKRTELEQQNEKLGYLIKQDKKMGAIKNEAAKLGIRDEAIDDLDHYDTSSVIVETTDQGNLNVLGAREFVESLKISKSYLFQDMSAPKVNNGAPQVETERKKLTPMQVVELQKKDPAAYKAYMKNNYGLA
jgi:hypothetical protein